MNHLHAYWRMEYVENPHKKKSGSQTFVQLLEADQDEENLILHRGPETFIIMNRFPYNAGHLMILPNRQVTELEELTPSERSEMFEQIIHGKGILSKAINPDGFNVGINLGSAAGAGIPGHLHTHIVPRWGGDTNFMPVLGQTGVLPTSLESLYHRLKQFVRT
ncbi:MAG: HIT domain-containing protein [Verrucomicrobiota bacterium]